jgi:hypothetical protein
MATRYRYPAVANGLRTDHPVPGLPFVNDAILPLDDRFAIEAIGRIRGQRQAWGREDPCRGDAGWVAFTTDPVRQDLAWVVRSHPVQGRSVLLFRNRHVADQHSAWSGAALLFRAGAYWWDGHMWFRPLQLWDAAREYWVQRPVPVATTITAADHFAAGEADPARGAILDVIDVDPAAAAVPNWTDHLALWALRRSDARPLSECVVGISAPELTGDQLVGIAGMAEAAGVAPSTLRAYIARGEADVPVPQATINGRSVWARPVAEEWAEARRRSHHAVGATVSTTSGGIEMSIGAAEVHRVFGDKFHSLLWDNPSQRRRWTLRWRTETSVRELTDRLGWQVAAGVEQIVPMGPLATTVAHAVLDELAGGRALLEGSGGTGRKALTAVDARTDPTTGAAFYGITQPVAQMLDWLIRHDPAIAGYTINEVIGEAELRFCMPRDVVQNSIRTALSLDSQLGAETVDAFLAKVLPPTSGGE